MEIVLLLLCGLLVAQAGASSARRLHASPPAPRIVISSPGNLNTTFSSCQWPAGATSCTPTWAPVFAKGAATINPANFPARALAYQGAIDLFCSQFSQSQCAYPCEFTDGVGCHGNSVDGAGSMSCPGSMVSVYTTCSTADKEASQPACLTNPACAYVPNAASDSVCTAKWAANVPGMQLVTTLSLQFTIMPRQLMGCCMGSVYLFKAQHSCDGAFDKSGNTSPEQCAKVPGCTWDKYTCLSSSQALVNLQFASAPADPWKGVFSKLANDCAAIKDPNQCNSFKPVAVDPAKVSFYLNDNLSAINTPVSAKDCPLPSMTLLGQ